MTWALIAHTNWASGTAGGTTAAIDTTGADLIVIVATAYNATYDTEVTVSDSKGNAWTRATRSPGTAYVIETDIQYVQAPTVGTGHTFTLAGATTYLAFEVVAFSGSSIFPVDQTNNHEATGVTSLQAGSITPGSAGELVIIGGGANASATPPTVDSGFAVTDAANYDGAHFSGVLAYLAQGSPAAVNPGISWDGTSTFGSCAIASFKGASGGALLVIDRTLPVEWSAVLPGVDAIMPFEMLAGAARDGAVPIENLARAIRDELTPAESTARVVFHLGLPSIEALSGQRAEIGATLEALMTAVLNTDFRGEALGAVTAERTIGSEFLQTRLFTSDSLLATEWLMTALRDQPIGDEWLGAIRGASAAQLELATTLLQHVGAPGEITGSARGDSSLLAEWTGTLTALLAYAGIPIEVSGSIAVAGVGAATEIIAKATADIRGPAEFLSFARHDEPTRAEFLAGRSVRDDAVAFELLALLHSLHRLPIEWSALPAIVRVSLERLLASPSKRRILGTPGRFRLLKRQ